MGKRVNRVRNIGLLELSARYVDSIKTYKTRMIARRACELFYEFTSSRGEPDIYLHELTRTDLEDFVKWARGQGLSDQSVYAYWRSFKRALSVTLDQYPDMKIPAIRSRWRSRGKPVPVVMDGAEVTHLLDTISVPWLADMVHLCLMTGLRLGEVCNLRWTDVDLHHRFILVRSKEGWTPKTGADSDVIALHEDAIALLTRLPHAGEYVFMSTTGKPRYAWYVSHLFKIMVRRADLDTRIHFHTLRHTFATLLLRSGVGIYEVSKLMRHQSIATTEIYLHVLARELHGAVNKMKILRTDREAKPGRSVRGAQPTAIG